MIDDSIKTTEEPQAIAPEITKVDLGFVEKRKFSISGDFNRILELNVSDLNIAARLKVGYPQLKELLNESQKTITSIKEDEDDFVTLGRYADVLTEIDKKMRGIIDYIFDTNASEVCAPSGNMYDPVGGQWRFERIIDVLSSLYTNGLDEEFNKLKKRVESKTTKYTKKGSKYHK